jgi:hypothetical protein
MTRAATWSDVLPTGGILDHILATVRIKNHSAQYSSATPMLKDHISKIEVKGDGMEPFKDYRGETCLAEYALAEGKLPPGTRDVMSANYQSQTFPILFGRKPFDGKYGFDLSGVSETRLDITNDFTTSDYDSTANIELDVDLWFLEDAPKPANYFQTYEKTAHTWTGASQSHLFDVPLKEKVRRMYLAAIDARTSATSAQSNKAWRNLRYLKYTYRTGADVVRDDDLYRSDQDCLWGYPDFVRTDALLEARSGYYFDTMICRPTGLSVTPAYSSDPGSAYSITVDQRAERFLAIRRSDQEGFQARMLAEGFGPLDHLCLHEDWPDEESRYLDPSARNKVEIEVGNSSSGGSSGTIAFILQVLKAQPVKTT